MILTLVLFSYSHKNMLGLHIRFFDHTAGLHEGYRECVGSKPRPREMQLENMMGLQSPPEKLQL